MDKEIYWVLERQVTGFQGKIFTEFVDDESNGYHGTYYLPDAMRFNTKELAESFKPAYGYNKTLHVAEQYEIIFRKLS
jgi:hypothetical protein